MNVLLINPFYPIDETPTPPLGLAFLGAALEAAGHRVRVLDFVVFPYSKAALARQIRQWAPGMIGITSVTMTFDSAVEVAVDAKSAAPGIPVVMGGPHVSFRPVDTMGEHPEIDVVVLGEGETTIVDLADALGTGGDLSGIDGIAYRHHFGIRQTRPRALCPDINQLPMPARHLLPLGRYRALNLSISMTTSRGCPFKCIFCVGRKMVGARVRYRDPVRVADELSLIARMGFPQINIADDLFTANAGHCHAVCDEIIRRGLDIHWTSFARVDTVSVPVLKKMKAAGCTAVSFGLETGSPGILRTIRKGITRRQIREAVEMCNAAGVIPHGSFILGLPGETTETVAETLAFGRELESMGVSYGFHVLAPFPGTEVRDRAADYGITILTDDWSQYHANRCIADTGGVDPAVLDDIVIGWKKRFDDWLGDVDRRMRTGEASAGEAAQLTNLKRTVMIYDLMMNRRIEQLGAMDMPEWPVDNADATAALADRLLAGMPGSDAAELRHAVCHAVENGHLVPGKTDHGRVRWHWAETLTPAPS